jgi:hypothetical protein
MERGSPCRRVRTNRGTASQRERAHQPAHSQRAAPGRDGRGAGRVRQGLRDTPTGSARRRPRESQRADSRRAGLMRTQDGQRRCVRRSCTAATSRNADAKLPAGRRTLVGALYTFQLLGARLGMPELDQGCGGSPRRWSGLRRPATVPGGRCWVGGVGWREALGVAVEQVADLVQPARAVAVLVEDAPHHRSADWVEVQGVAHPALAGLVGVGWGAHEG